MVATRAKRSVDVGVIRVWLAVCACLGAVDAFAQSLEVDGACRTGVPNGAYELRLGDGSLLVAGAFSQGRMTGTFIFWNANGARLAVLPLDNDARSGTVALWYTGPGGRTEAGHKLEAPYVEDRLHGVKRSWYAGGAPRTEARYEHGLLREARAWTAAGAALTDAEARDIVERDAEADERAIAALLSLVRTHPPICDPATPDPPEASPERPRS